MNLRQLLNVAYAHISKLMGRDVVDEILAAKRWEDMTPAERKREERKRIAMQTGAYQGQAALVGQMGLPQGRRARPT